LLTSSTETRNTWTYSRFRLSLRLYNICFNANQFITSTLVYKTKYWL